MKIAFYKAFLIRAMQFYFPDLVIGEVSPENSNDFMMIPSKRTIVSYYGLWNTNGFDQSNWSENRQESSLSGYRRIRIEEWHRIPKEQEISEDGVIRIRRFQSRAIQAGVKRSIQLSETLLSELLQEHIALTPEQTKDCMEFAQSNSRSVKKEKQKLER